MLNGIILIDKPQGITSFGVVSIAKKLFETKKVGHAGTLDPMATGLLPILLNKATKIQGMLQSRDKEYLAEFKLGITTDTQDITGKIMQSTKKVDVTENKLLEVLENFTGNILQLPPMYSAVSKNGVRLYKLARKGIEIERNPRKITINKINLVKFDKQKNVCTILVNCSKGTYIRTLCADIGDFLGCGATLTMLRRTATCNFSVKDSITIEKLEKLKENHSLENAVIPLEAVFSNYHKIILNESFEKMFRNGRKIKTMLNCSKQELLVFNEKGTLLGLGLYSTNNKELSVYKMLI